MNKNSTQIGKAVLSELDWFGENFSVAQSTAAVMNEQRLLLREPFIAYVRVTESVDNGLWAERVYLICRNDIPSNLAPRNENALFANRNALIGRIASLDPKEEITIKMPWSIKKKTIKVIEKDIFRPSSKNKVWDALNNQISFGLDDEYIHSLRDVLGGPVHAVTPVPSRAGLETLQELQELERAHAMSQGAANEHKLNRTREIVESIALKDQPILDRSQDEFCRSNLNSQLILSGSPGTGKTTSIIKRIAMKANAVHLNETEGITLEDHRLSNWLMFTPNNLLKIYLKEAMNKEGLTATDQYVTTWERERGILSRDVLQILKIGNKGYLSKTNRALLKDTSSVGTVKAAKAFLTFFDSEILFEIREAIKNLNNYPLKSSFLTKKTHPIAERFRFFVSGCKNVRFSKFGPSELGSMGVIEQMSRIFGKYQTLRGNIEDLINNFVDLWIKNNPSSFDELVEYINTPALKEQPVPGDDSLDQENPEQDADDEQVEDDRSATDPRLIALNQLRRAVRGRAEAMVSKKPIKDKNRLFIWEYMQVPDDSQMDLILAGHLSLALKPRIFRVANFNAYIRDIPRSFQRYRLAELKKDRSAKYPESSTAEIKDRRISNDEIDLVIFTMLQLVSVISKRDGAPVESDLQRDLLSKVIDQYRTQIAIDEATDFSALQLASIYLLTDPEFHSVTFSGDLMQRVTTTGISSWSELTDLIPSIKQYDLVASYRQTPTLLKIAKKLYKSIIGEEPPFDSRHHDHGTFPAPLKYKGPCDEGLANWLAERVHEIYKINGETLPSIAVFVPTEDDIAHVNAVLSEALNEYSIDVEACMLGKVLGTGSNVRIFSIEYIKGLEFEGVFYIDIDRAYESHPGLVDKYLYVGLTRATTFLGVTYSEKFPDSIEFLGDDFDAGDWSSFL